MVIIQMIDGSKKTVTYPSITAAGAAFDVLSNAVATTIPGTATLISISPTSGAANGDVFVTITGTNFLPSAVITIGGIPLDPTNFVSGTILQGIFDQFSLGAGTYDVVYADAAGGSATLPAAYTVT